MFWLVRRVWRPLSQRFQSVSMSQEFNNQNFPYQTLFIQPPADTIPELTTEEIHKTLSIGVVDFREEGMKETVQRREAMMKLLPTDSDHLPPRKMEDSFVSAIIPLKTIPKVRNLYVEPDGNLRIGRFLEDMDLFSHYCCSRHILNPKSPVTVGPQSPYAVVTLLVDNIYITNDKMKNYEDVRLSGHVTYAGNTSLEVCMVIDQKDDEGVYRKCLEAIFLMVARDRMHRGSARVNPLAAETPEEREFISKGKARQQNRKELEDENIFKKPPNETERKIIHDRFIEKRKATKDIYTNSRKMRNSVLKTVFICQPQYRNMYNKIFGGYTMRMAYELALANTFIFCKKRPRIVNIDDIKFLHPVEIGSILRFRSHIGYVKDNFVQSVVYAEIVYPKTGEILKANEFHVTFLIQQEAGEEPVPRLDFETYEEAIHYLNSRRHFKKMMKAFGGCATQIGK
ncbi:Acyl-coenzyme A thioesterase 9, mitochondrial [Orchesella cincta]|uniref:Acyl-coenzyme A thioesterase 9, mitochondrial n=1 Tax=Orchesella cincta TaxID=48709 RepID=A0A1D2MJL2_ORCCI|nr:Acyl-coenzyme A thioesterase 9, mitochondrial [Orchesella cincta]